VCTFENIELVKSLTRYKVLKLTGNSATVLGKVCEYLTYKQREQDATDIYHIPLEISLLLLVAADYLESKLIQTTKVDILC